MRNHDLDARGEVRGGVGAANGAAVVGSKPRKLRTRRSWSVEEKVRIARESFASAETITAVAKRHGIPRNRLSSWRTQLRRGQLVAPSPALPARVCRMAWETAGLPGMPVSGWPGPQASGGPQGSVPISAGTLTSISSNASEVATSLWGVPPGIYRLSPGSRCTTLPPANARSNQPLSI